jgi:hypothetical protein
MLKVYEGSFTVERVRLKGEKYKINAESLWGQFYSVESKVERREV